MRHSRASIAISGCITRSWCVAAVLLFPASFAPPQAGAQTPQQWEFAFMQTPDGVPLSEVRGIAEDAAGQIWVATWGNGIARLTATDWLTLDESTGLAGNWVRGLAVGEDDTVWITTADGLCLYRNGNLERHLAENVPALPTDNLDTVHPLPGGDLLLGTREGHVLLGHGASRDAIGALGDPARWSIICDPGIPRGTRLVDVHDGGGGLIWLSHRGDDVHRHTGGNFTFQGGPVASVLFAGQPGQPPWAVERYRRQIYRLVEEHWRPAIMAPENVSALILASDGWLYAGTESGLFRSNGGPFETVPLGDNVGKPNIVVIRESADGALWLGSQEGLIRGALRSWKHFGTTRQGDSIVALLPDPRRPGALVAVDAVHGLARFENGQWNRYARLDTPEIVGRFLTGHGGEHLWALGAATLYQFSLDDGALLGRTELPSMAPDNRLFQTLSGEIWLLGMDGVWALAGGVWAPRPEAPDYTRRRVYAVAEPAPGVFFAGLSSGIERWHGSGVEYFGRDAGVAEGDEAVAIHAADDGTVWFGTYGSGVYAFDGEAFTNFNVRDGIAHHSVSTIQETGDGAIWVAYRRSGVASYRDGRWLNYGIANGIPNTPVVAMHEDGAGQFWVQTRDEGMYRYRPDTTPPDTFLEGATFEVPARGIGVFSFSAIDGWQRTPNHLLLYSWRLLEGAAGAVHTPWSPYVPRATFITPPLPPGTYTIEARAADHARNPDPTPASATFEVYPPIWREPGVVAPAMALALLLLVAFVLRARANRDLRRSKVALSQSNRQLMSEIRERLLAEQRLNEHFEQLEELVAGRTADLEAAQRALVQQERLAMLGKVTASVSHELRNPLGTLRSTVFTISRKVQGKELGLEEAIQRAERSIQRCDRIIEEFLDFTRAVSMERECIDLDAWLEGALKEMPFPESVACHFTFESKLNLAVDPERLRRAVVNVVNNAVQAMAEVGEGYKRLRIKSRVRDNRFEIVVKDNGTGITDEGKARIFEPLYSTKGFGVGLGMSIVKDIMEKHQGGVEYHSVLGKGTTVVLWIPIP